jgi:hypothetical protein
VPSLPPGRRSLPTGWPGSARPTRTPWPAYQDAVRLLLVFVQIAHILNAEGFRTPKRTSRFVGGQVRAIINQRAILTQPKGRPAVLTGLPAGERSVTGLSPNPECPPRQSTPGSTAGGSPPATRPELRTGSSSSTTSVRREPREHRARPPGGYTRARWSLPEPEPDSWRGEQP